MWKFHLEWKNEMKANEKKTEQSCFNYVYMFFVQLHC